MSIPEVQFLNYLHVLKRNIYIKPYRVDGYHVKTNTIYEFLGDYWHGNPEKFKRNNYNKICHKTYGDLYNFTFNKFKKLKQLGYKIRYIWENDWNKFKNGIDKSPNIITY